jgi:hypothetical protein
MEPFLPDGCGWQHRAAWLGTSSRRRYLPRTPLLSTRVHRASDGALSFSGWHHGRCRSTRRGLRVAERRMSYGIGGRTPT